MTPDRIGTPRDQIAKLVWDAKYGRIIDPDAAVDALMARLDWTGGTGPATHVALSLDPQKRVELREAIAIQDPEAWMLNAGFRRGVDTALAVLLGSGGGS